MENGRERQVGGEVSTTMHKNDFKKDSPVPYFRLFLVLLLFNRRLSKVGSGRE